MKHSILWNPAAQRKLEQIIGSSDDPAGIALLVRALDGSLSRHPRKIGESRYDNVRVGFAPPLGVQFEVFTDPPTVVVYDVWKYGKG